MRGSKNTADIELPKQLPGRINPIALAAEAYVHHRQGRTVFPGEDDRLLCSGRSADDAETTLYESGFRLHRDEKIILDEEDARWLLLFGSFRPPLPLGTVRHTRNWC